MTSAWHWIQEINKTVCNSKPQVKSNLQPLDMGNSGNLQKTTPGQAARVIESMHGHQMTKGGSFVYSRWLKEAILKDTAMTIEQWKRRCALERAERSRLEEARAQDRKGTDWSPGASGA